MKPLRNKLIVPVTAIGAVLSTISAAAALDRSVQWSAAATPPPSPQSLSTDAVGAFYNRYRLALWFRDGRPTSAAGQLVTILERARLDGLQNGPQLAEQVEAAVRGASTGDASALVTAERLLSATWVAYVQAVRRPTAGMIYAYPSLAPQQMTPEMILRTAAAAPSMEQHVEDISKVNHIYAELREAAWQQMQEAGRAANPRLLANMERARSLPQGGRFVLVDAGSQRLWMYEDGKPVGSMKVIVGTNEFPTPMIASIIHYVTFNPYWNVPEHLVRKTLAPRVLGEGSGYLRKQGYEVMSDWSDRAAVLPPSDIDWRAVAAGKAQVRIRQLPGSYNSMGKLKFSFPNGEGIFLHDTPNKLPFAKEQRALSNGCVRVEDAARLARWMLGREPVAPSTEPEQFVRLPRGVPVYITYITARAVDGRLTFVEDVYGWDLLGSGQLASRD